MSKINSERNKKMYLQNTTAARQDKQESHFGNNLRLLQTIYQNIQNIDSQSQEEWAELMGLSRTNFRFWSTNRNTVPHYRTVKKVTDFFNQNLMLPSELTPSKIVNKNLTEEFRPFFNFSDLAFKSNKKNESILKSAWKNLTLKHKQDLFKEAYTKLNEGSPSDKSYITPKSCREYMVRLRKLNIKNEINKNPRLLNKITINKDIPSKGPISFIIDPNSNLTIHFNTEQLSIYRQRQLSINDKIMAAMKNTKYDSGTIKQTGVIKLFSFKNEHYIALCNIEIENINSEKPMIIYDIKEMYYKKISSIGQFYIFMNNIAEILKKNINLDLT